LQFKPAAADDDDDEEEENAAEEDGDDGNDDDDDDDAQAVDPAVARYNAVVSPMMSSFILKNDTFSLLRLTAAGSC